MNIVKFLTLEKCCDPMSRDVFNNTALHYAVAGDQLETLAFLIEELKCPPDTPGVFNKTPLQMAIRMNHFEIAKYLQKHSVLPYIYTALAIIKHLGSQE